MFLTTKERRVYKDDGSGTTVMVTGTGTNALTYVLLHESSHVVDGSCGITDDPQSRFVSRIWKSNREMDPSLAAIAPRTFYRGASPLPTGQAATVYDTLAQTPFVSLYATASREEDSAELVAWHEILEQHHGNLLIDVKNAQGEVVKHWEPLTFSGVQRRLADVDELLASQGRCRDLS